MAGRNGRLISFLAIILLMAMVGGYILLQDTEDDPLIAYRGGGASHDREFGDEFGAPDVDDDAGDSASSRSNPNSDDQSPDIKRAGKGIDAAGADDAGGKKTAEVDPASINPEDIEGAVPGWLAIQVVDRDDERPVSGTSVYFPVQKSKLDTDLGQVKVDSALAAVQRRTNRHGIAAWSQTELTKLLDAIKKADAAQKKDPKKKIKKPIVNVLITALGYADMFEPVKIPNLANGALVQFKLIRSVMVTGKVREKRGGIIRDAEVDILQTSQQGNAASAKPLNRFRIHADGMGEFSVKLAENFIYTFEVKHGGFAKYTSRAFNFREDQREISILLEAAKGISGVVLAHNGKPVEGAEVRAKDDGDSVLTDKNGKFQFDMVKDRIFRNDVNLRISADGYAPKE
ncbi:carboxypeptidase-like regulatory domain-containing protein, partial [Planctomycetota bacterium]|nr:carboxypeptidase-like regulatory domain-containing protein [Planctomycetota bacterium]